MHVAEGVGPERDGFVDADEFEVQVGVPDALHEVRTVGTALGRGAGLRVEKVRRAETVAVAIFPKRD